MPHPFAFFAKGWEFDAVPSCAFTAHSERSSLTARNSLSGTGTEALDEPAPNAGLKPGSSTEPASVTTADAATNAGTTVEERPFQGRVEKRKKENNSALPKAVAGGQSPQATVATTNVDIFLAFVKAGQRLAEIHVHYEQQPEYPLKKVEKTGEQLDYRVEKMKLSKDKTQLIYNKFLTLDGRPLAPSLPSSLRKGGNHELRHLPHRKKSCNAATSPPFASEFSTEKIAFL